MQEAWLILESDKPDGAEHRVYRVLDSKLAAATSGASAAGRKEQASLVVHSTRSLLVRQRTMAANALRAALSEIGIVAAQG